MRVVRNEGKKKINREIEKKIMKSEVTELNIASIIMNR